MEVWVGQFFFTPQPGDLFFSPPLAWIFFFVNEGRSFLTFLFIVYNWVTVGHVFFLLFLIILANFVFNLSGG